MPYHHAWLVANRVIYARVWGDQDIEEITRSSKELTTKLDSGTPLIHLLMDDSELGNVPIRLAQLGDALSFARHKSLGWVVLVGNGSRVTNFVMEMLGKIFRVNVRREATLDSAIGFLKSRDITVPWEQVDPQVTTRP